MALRFLDHGGEMGRRIRAHDWTASPLGPIAQWPAVLRSALGICLGSGFPTAVYWGPQLCLLYNDAWAFIPGARHPDCLGRPAAQVWPEIWDVIAPQLEQVLRTGDGFVAYDQMLMMTRDGRPTETWWNYSFTPIRDEGGEIVGIFNQGNEITRTVEAERARTAQLEQLQVLFDQAPGAVAILSGADHRFQLANPAYRALVGRGDLVGLTVAEALPEVRAQGFIALLDRVFETGESYRGDGVHVQLAPASGEARRARVLDFVYQPVRDHDDRVIGIFVQAQDVTERADAQSALLTSEARLKLALESSHGLGIWDWNLETGIATADAGFAALYGVDPAHAAAGAPATEFFRQIHPDDYPRVAALTRDTIVDGAPYSAEYRVRAPDGGVRWVSARGSRSHDAAGAARFAGVSFDITERKAAEETALASAAELRQATEAQAFLYAVAEELRAMDDGDAIMALAVERVAHQLNVDRAGFFRSAPGDPEIHFVACWTNGKLPALSASLPRAMIAGPVREKYAAGRTFIVNDSEREVEYRGTAIGRMSPAGVAVPLMRGGEWVASLYVSQAEPRRWRESEVALIEAVAEQAWDAVQRAEAMAALSESEAKFRAITNSIDQMVWSTRPDGFHDFYNDRWYEFTGVPHGSTDGEGWNAMFHPEDQDRAWARWRWSLETGEPYRIEYRLRHNSGTYRWVLGRAQPVLGPDGRITRWFGTCTDIQESMDAREVLARSREELERLVTERTDRLMAAEEQLRQAQKMEAVGQLTGGIAHDFNNMLAVVLGALDLMERRLARGEQDVGRYVGAAREGAERAAALTRRLLAFARRQPLSPRPVIASQLVEGMADLLSRTLGDDIRLVTDLDPMLWQARVDPGQLENGVINLCVNARDAMPDGGTLTLATANASLDLAEAARWDVAPGDYVSLSVGDTGTGMSAEVLERALEPFFTTKPVGRGTGLGLSQVFGFVRQSGGGLHIESDVGAGTLVTLLLPRDAGPPPPPPEPETQGDAPRAQAGETVMAVEDDPRVRAYTVEALRELGYAVIEAEDGAHALALLQGGARPDLMLSDLVMPGMNGRELAAAAAALRPDLPVLFTSGYDRDRRPAGIDEDADPVLVKPFGVADLARRVRRAIDRARA